MAGCQRARRQRPQGPAIYQPQIPKAQRSAGRCGPGENRRARPQLLLPRTTHRRACAASQLESPAAETDRHYRGLVEQEVHALFKEPGLRKINLRVLLFSRVHHRGARDLGEETATAEKEPRADVPRAARRVFHEKDTAAELARDLVKQLNVLEQGIVRRLRVRKLVVSAAVYKLDHWQPRLGRRYQPRLLRLPARTTTHSRKSFFQSPQDVCPAYEVMVVTTQAGTKPLLCMAASSCSQSGRSA